MTLDLPDDYAYAPAGTFIMGSSVGELGRDNDEILTEVTSTRAISVGRTEVTQAQWFEVMGTLPSKNRGCDAFPVELVSWFDAVNYSNALSVLDGLTSAYLVDGEDVRWDQTADDYRLPTEAAGEYATRAGTATAFYNEEITSEECDDPYMDRIG